MSGGACRRRTRMLHISAFDEVRLPTNTSPVTTTYLFHESFSKSADTRSKPRFDAKKPSMT
jgi:hypothetical protein